MTPKIYLINLARSPDRLGYMERQLKARGLAFERVEAIDGKDLPPARIRELAVPERVEEWKFLLTPNAIGCALAHRSAYQMFLKDGGETAIGTDDLESGRIEPVERAFLADKSLLARKLQIYAARAIDQGRLSEARSLIRRAFGLSPMRPALARTILYYCRAVVRGSRARP